MSRIIFFLSLLTIVRSDIIGYCDIKGNVNNPGVYEIRENETINDIINKAGGLKKNSYTENINLSKLVTDQMVIYIHSKSEINKANELSNCKCEPIIKYIECEQKTTTTTKPFEIKETTTSKIIESTRITTTNKVVENTTKYTTTKVSETTTNKVSKKININAATLEDLKTLNGLGDSKANKVIEYRNNNGKFETIEDLLKVDGIGVKIFENIKDYIEV